MSEKLSTGEITIEELNQIDGKRDQMKRLCSAVSSGKQETQHDLYLSVETSLKKRLEEWDAYKQRSQVLSHLCDQIRSVDDNIKGIIVSILPHACVEF